MTNNTNQNENNQEVEFHVPPDLEYHYRDIFNVYVGVGEVIIEFGNIHRAMPGHATVSNRIVISVGNAYTLAQALQQSLQQAQMQIQKNMQEQKE